MKIFNIRKKDVCVLVYQGGIANVFKATVGGPRERIMQRDFKTCENYVRGVAAAGVRVLVAWCNEAGEIKDSHWHFTGFENAPFHDQFSEDLLVYSREIMTRSIK